jgi:hypothetical protein
MQGELDLKIDHSPSEAQRFADLVVELRQEYGDDWWNKLFKGVTETEKDFRNKDEQNPRSEVSRKP